MIPVSITHLFFIYLLVFLAVIFTVWILSGVGRSIREKNSAKGKTQCTICGLTYGIPRSAGPYRCPRCGTLNEKNPINQI